MTHVYANLVPPVQKVGLSGLRVFQKYTCSANCSLLCVCVRKQVEVDSHHCH
jgi:hypothetical protein